MKSSITITTLAYNKVFEALQEKYKWDITVGNSSSVGSGVWDKSIDTELPVFKEMKATFESHIEYLNQFIKLIDEEIEYQEQR